MDCVGSRALLQQFVVGAAEGDVAEAIAHVGTCAECRLLFDVEPTAACDAVEEDLLEAGRSRLGGVELADSYPAVAQHIQGCERCQAVFADLTTESRGAPDVPEPPEDQVHPRAIFERAYVEALRDPEAIVRLRAVEGLREVRRLEASERVALASAAESDPVQEVRSAARTTLDLHARPATRGNEKDAGGA